MKKFAVALNDFQASQLSVLVIKNINEWMKKNYLCDIIGFYNNCTNFVIEPNFCCMPSSELWGYDGIVIATDFNSAEIVLRSPSISRKYFYIWDLEWFRLKEKDFLRLSNVYKNQELEVITRNQEYAQVIEKVWGRKVKFKNEYFDINYLMRIINDSCIN